tara:strand:- start:655 stop:1080 length:426 start_codon:yes stop_codon:yes gene_type:complete
MFIQIRNGTCFEHPILEDNMQQLFPDHDLQTAPDGFAHFVAVAQPVLGPYQYIDNSRGFNGSGCEYEATENGFTDVWYILEMTAAEKIEKQNLFKASWAIAPNWSSWTFNETTCAYEPPTAMPLDGEYSWDESTTSWATLP